MGALGWVLAGLLVVIGVRRSVLLVAAVWPGRWRDPESPAERPGVVPGAGSVPNGVLVVVPVRDEADALPHLLDALDALEPPYGGLRAILVNDGSNDETGARMRAWASGRSHASVMDLPESVGKARALNGAIASTDFGDAVAVFDADQRPAPSAVARLQARLADPSVGAVSGVREPRGVGASFVSRYAALELWVHQWVVQAGKERLGWNPPTMGGNCLYRRSALSQVRGFPASATSEDTEVSLAMVRSGWRTVFEPGAVARNAVPVRFRDFARQRARWTRGMYAASKHARGPEAWFVASGYADRLVLAAALVAVGFGSLPAVWLAVYVAPPLGAVLVGLTRGRAGVGGALTLLALPVLFAVDVAVTAGATVSGMLGRPVVWRPVRNTEVDPAVEDSREVVEP